MNISKRLLGAALGAAVFAAAGPAAAATEVPFWHAFSPDIPLGKLLTRLVDEFNQSQQAYKVNLVYKGTYDDTVNATIAAYRAKQHPVIVQIVANAAPTMIYSPSIVPVDKMMADAGHKVDWSRFIPPVVAAFQRNGAQMALPFNSSTPILWYNVDAMAKIGATTPPTTWDEVGEMARKFKAAGFDCGVTSAWQNWVNWENYSSIQNLPLATKANGRNGLDAEYVYNKTGFVNHVKRIKGWMGGCPVRC